jgi:predicted nucleic acid-binding protein
MRSGARFVLDTNAFIEAYRRYYAFDICPGYWAVLIAHHGGGRLCSIDRVRSELLALTDQLSQWAQRLPGAFFEGTGDQTVVTWFSNIMAWVQAQAQYFSAAKAAFAAGADGWLIAYAKTQGLIVVTNEQPAPASKRQVKIPDVCNAFGVNYIETFGMLRALGASFH